MKENNTQIVTEKWIKPPNLVVYTNSRLTYCKENTLLCEFNFPVKYQKNSYILLDREALLPGQMHSGKRYFYTDRFYSLLEYYDTEGNLTAYYLDLTLPAKIQEDQVLIADLKIDFFVFPDKKSYLLLDEDELEEAIEKGYFSDKEISACLETKDFIIKCIKEDKFDTIFTGYTRSDAANWPVYDTLSSLEVLHK